MRELVFALEFRGEGRAVPDSATLRRARTRACMSGGETAELDAEVERYGDGTFVERGTIRYGAGGGVTFETVGRGWVEQAPSSDGVAGGVVWTVTGGDGEFAGARGLITSNFTVSAAGEVVDNHVARLYLPSP